MDKGEVISCLKEDFGIKDSHYDLLKEVVFNEKLTANQLSEKTGIAISKIYRPITELVNCGLLLKTNSRPTCYYLGDIRKNVLNYLKIKFNVAVCNELELINSIEDKDKEWMINEISDNQDYVFNVRKILATGKNLKIITMDGVFPTLFYTDDEKTMLKIRLNELKKRKTLMGAGEILKDFHTSFWDIYNDKNSKFRYIISQHTLKLYKEHLFSLFKKEEIVKLMLSIKDWLKNFNISIKIIKNGSPFCMFISENRMMFTIFNIYTSGLITNNKRIVYIYSKLFDDMWKDAKSVEPFLDEIMYEAVKNGKNNK